uniref:HTH_48 domain-containing protein n=1 Tax=Haemonchus contortus TaxID=6289 RepID=A0A7I4YDM6_HAECO
PLMLTDMPPLDRQVRVCILYEFKLGNVANLAFLNVNRAFGEGTVSNVVVHRWFARFQEGDEDLDNEPTKELDINDETIEEDPAVVEALLSKQYGVPPGTLYTYLDRMGRGERLHELEPEELGLPGNSDNPRSMQTLLMKLGLARGSQPSASLRSLIENGTVRLIPSVKEDEDVKPEGPSDDFPEEITVKDIFQAHPKLLLPSSSTQNGHSVEYNKVRICDNGREYRNTLASSSNKIGVVIDPPSLNPSSGVQKTVTRGSSGSSVIARSLACLAKYRTTSQESEKTLLNPVKPPQADEISNGSIEKVVKAEAVELPSEPAEMKEHIVPLF